MARNAMPSGSGNGAQKAAQTPSAEFVTKPIGGQTPAPMRGGSAGVIPAQAPRAISQQAQVVADARRDERPGVPRARKFRVVNGGFVVLGGFRTAMRAGKIIEETQYDVPGLIDQGLVLEEIDPPPPPAPVEEVAASEGEAASV